MVSVVTSNVVNEQRGVEMTDELERRWDDAMEEAWTGFRGRLADRLAGLDDGGSLIVQLPEEDDLLGATPYCQALLDGGWLRVEAVSNEFLDAHHLLAEAQEQTLVGLGYDEPAEGQSPNFWVDLEHREVDRAAWLMVRAMREVYGVVHPVYLEADGLEPMPVEDPGVSRLASLAPQPPGVVEDVREPQGSDELKEWLLDLVRDHTGVDTELDEDGDIPFFTDKAVFYVTVSTRAARVLIHSTLVTDVVDEERALVEVNLLNRAEFGVTFLLNDATVSVRRELPMGALVPADFRAEIHRLSTDADRWCTELHDRLGGRLLGESEVKQPRDRRRTASAEPTDERFDQAMRVLRELESEERGSVDTATIARIFHGDRDLLLKASRSAASSSARWNERRRKADEEGKVAFAKGCRAQQRYYHQLRGRIRAALRGVVQAPVAKPERQAQLSLFAEDEATS